MPVEMFVAELRGLRFQVPVMLPQAKQSWSCIADAVKTTIVVQLSDQSPQALMLPVCPDFIRVHGDDNIRPGAAGDLTQHTLQPGHIPIADTVVPTVFVIDPRNS